MTHKQLRKLAYEAIELAYLEDFLKECGISRYNFSVRELKAILKAIRIR